LFSAIELRLCQLLQNENEKILAEFSPSISENKDIIDNIKLERRTSSFEKILKPRQTMKFSLRGLIKENQESEKFEIHSKHDKFIKKDVSGTRKQIVQEKSRLIEYYNNSYIYLKMKFGNGVLNILARIIIFLLFINGNTKTTIISVYFCIAGVLVWREPKFNIKLLVKITDFMLVMIVLQYLFLVLNLNNLTSPIQIPTEVTQSSFIEYLFEDPSIQMSPYLRLMGFGNSF